MPTGTETATQPGPGESSIQLTDFLRDRDVPCPLCGYNLRALASSRCPECGQELRLSVTLAEPYLRAWLALAVSAFAGAGGGLFMLAIISAWGWPSFEDRWMYGMVIYFLLCLPLSGAAVFLRRRFLRMRRRVQWWSAAIFAGLTVASFVELFIEMRR